MITRISLLVLASSIVFASCENDLAGPDTIVAGVLQARSVDGRAVPFISNGNSTTDCITVYEGGTLTLDGKGRFELTRNTEREFCDGQQFRYSVLRQRGQYKVQGELIEFTPDQGSSFGGRVLPYKELAPGHYRPLQVHFEVDGRKYEYLQSA